MKYRGRFEIVLQMLKIIDGVEGNNAGAIKTNIMYKAFLSFPQLKDYLSFLESKELIVFRDGKYFLTEKGVKTLKVMTNLRSVLSIDVPV